MDLFVVRHAIAAPLEDGMLDEERPLTERGRQRFRRCVRGLERLGVVLDRMLFSPALRCVQTADLLADLLEGETAVSPSLAAAPSAALLAEIAERGQSVACVGHEPWCSDLVGLLVGGTSAPLRLEVKKGGVAWLRGELSPGGMALLALLQPRALVRIG